MDMQPYANYILVGSKPLCRVHVVQEVLTAARVASGLGICPGAAHFSAGSPAMSLKAAT